MSCSIGKPKRVEIYMILKKNLRRNSYCSPPANVSDIFYVSDFDNEENCWDVAWKERGPCGKETIRHCHIWPEEVHTVFFKE